MTVLRQTFTGPLVCSQGDPSRPSSCLGAGQGQDEGSRGQTERMEKVDLEVKLILTQGWTRSKRHGA